MQVDDRQVKISLPTTTRNCRLSEHATELLLQLKSDSTHFDMNPSAPTAAETRFINEKKEKIKWENTKKLMELKCKDNYAKRQINIYHNMIAWTNFKADWQ